MTAQHVLLNSSAVVIANDVNISIFKPWWLIKSGILKPEEVEGEVVVTPVMVRVPAPAFELVVVPNRVQMTFEADAPEIEGHISRVLGGIVETLPHTPYSAVGLNFHYVATPPHEVAFARWDRDNFASQFANSVTSGEDNEARFGSYVSYNVEGLRMKLDVKPVKATGQMCKAAIASAIGEELIALNFNFHKDVEQGANVAAVKKTLGLRREAAGKAKEIVTKLENEN